MWLRQYTVRNYRTRTDVSMTDLSPIERCAQINTRNIVSASFVREFVGGEAFVCDCQRLNAIVERFSCPRCQMPNVRDDDDSRCCRRQQNRHTHERLLYIANNKLSHRIASRSSAECYTHMRDVCYYISQHIMHSVMCTVSRGCLNNKM